MREGTLLKARLGDPRWESLSKEEQKRLATELLAFVSRHGIKVLTLRDANEHVRVMATAMSARQVLITDRATAEEAPAE